MFPPSWVLWRSPDISKPTRLDKMLNPECQAGCENEMKVKFLAFVGMMRYFVA
jgi:hypothetical protein